MEADDSIRRTKDRRPKDEKINAMEGKKEEKKKKEFALKTTPPGPSPHPDKSTRQLSDSERKAKAERLRKEYEAALNNAKEAEAKGKTLTYGQQKVLKIAKRLPLPSYNFAMTIVRHPDRKRYLLVQEGADKGYKWWLPGGRVEHGDSFAETALKETFEEGGALSRSLNYATIFV